MVILKRNRFSKGNLDNFFALSSHCQGKTLTFSPYQPCSSCTSARASRRHNSLLGMFEGIIPEFCFEIRCKILQSGPGRNSTSHRTSVKCRNLIVMGERVCDHAHYGSLIHNSNITNHSSVKLQNSEHKKDEDRNQWKSNIYVLTPGFWRGTNIQQY